MYNEEESYFKYDDFIDGFALIFYGEDMYDPFGNNYSNIIDTNGNFIDILLDKNIKYSNGKIVKLKNDDKGAYGFEISRILEYKKNGSTSSSIETAFFVIKVLKYDNDNLDLYYVINPQLDVIANFTDTAVRPWDNYDPQDCCTPTSRRFFFINEEREFLIFAKDKHIEAFDGVDVFADTSSQYGIIDCKIKSAKQLLPFTDDYSEVCSIVRDRYWEEKDLRISPYQSISLYGRGWDDDDEYFHGYILDDEIFDYPIRFKGYTLKYVYEFYPDRLEWMSENDIILIPNRLLDILGTSKLTREIRLNQEIHLSYSKIQSVSDCLNSTEYKGIISSYQGKTISQIIYKKGGTKHLVGLLRSGKLEIDRQVLEDLSKNAFNDIEEKCYSILISVIDKIESEREQYDDWIQRKMDEDYIEDYIREANRQFNDMMDDFDAWGNID